MALTERLLVLIDAKTGGAAGEFTKLQRKAQDLDATSTRTGRAVNRLGLEGKVSGQALKTGLAAGAIAAGTALAAFAAKGVKDFIDLAGKVRDFQRVTGTSAEEASRFVAVFDDLGIDADKASGSLFKLTKNINTNEKAMQAAGIVIAKNDRGQLDLTTTLLDLADAYAGTTDPARKAELATAAFGKQGRDLIPFLERGRDGLAELFEGAESGKQILSQKEIDKARDYELAIDGLQDTVSGLGREIGSVAVPALISFANAMVTLIEKGQKLHDLLSPQTGVSFEYIAEEADLAAVRRAGISVEQAAKSLDGFGGSTEQVRDVLLDAGYSAEEADRGLRSLGVTLDTVAEEHDKAAEAAKRQTDALNAYLDAVLGAADSQIAQERALLRVNEAAASYDTAQKGLADKTKDTAEEVRSAKSATLDLTDAYLNAAQAAVRHAEEQSKLSGSTLTASDRQQVLFDIFQKFSKTATPQVRAELALLQEQLANFDGSVDLYFRTFGVTQANESFRSGERASAAPPSPSAGRSTVVVNIGPDQVASTISTQTSRRTDRERRGG